MSIEPMRSWRVQAPLAASRRISALLGAAFALLAACAHADTAADVRTEIVTRAAAVGYADLNLARAADAQMLYSRLQLAARNVCGSYDQRQLRGRIVYERCYQQALADAVARVDHAAVTELYRENQRVRLARRNGRAAAKA